MTELEFIKKCIEKHGDKYDLSKVNYINNKTKILVTCNRCKTQFFIRPDGLLSNGGCIGCRKYHNKEYYIERFLKKHKQTYDYSLMEENVLYTKDSIIPIICHKHGKFEQKIKNHLQGNACSKCGLEKSISSIKKDLALIEERFKKLCGDTFEYEINEYKNTNTPIKLTCKKCKHEFYRDLNSLMYNNTCPFCNGKKRNLKYTNKEFIEVCKRIHGEKYDYSKTEYVKSDEKVCVVCHNKDIFGCEHGEFWVTPHSHIGKSKSGCPKCSRKHKKTSEEFINEANYIHNNFFNYSESVYVNAKTKLKIICPHHGAFYQTPNSHLSGEGCPICKLSVCERKLIRLFNKHNINYISQYKPDWLKPMSLDFFIPNHNIAIEVQGTQHFKPVKYWGGEKNYEKITKRDNKKLELCLKHNIKLVYYTEIKDENIRNVLKNEEELLKLFV